MISVGEYLDMMAAADRAPGTLRLYRLIFESFSRFLNVPLDELHNYLEPQNLIKYAVSLKKYSGQTQRERLAVIRAFYKENGVEFSGIKAKVLSARRRSDPEDKPLTLETLQRMMDIGDARSRAFITVMVSTGMRPGETAQLRLQDVKGDTVTIPGKIAKNGRGGKVYLTSEAREFLDLWLLERDKFIRLADIHAEILGKPRPANDDRLFASGYTGLNSMFRRLYEKVDGERGTYRRKITPHSMRKYFRTQATQGGLHIDIMERLMRHSGYLSGSYIRLTDEEIRRQFHAGEDALYITRRDRRHSENQLEILKMEKERQAAELDRLKRRMDAQDALLLHLKERRK